MRDFLEEEIVCRVLERLVERYWSDPDRTPQTDEELGLNDPQVIVEPDVKEKIKDYFHSMSLSKKGGKKSRRAKEGSVEDTTKSKLWRQ